MPTQNRNLRLTDGEIGRAFHDPTWGTAFPPILNVDQAAKLIGVPKATIYDWSSRGLLNGCSKKVGRHLRIIRDRFLKHIFNDGLSNG